jgi:hypothetical protein
VPASAIRALFVFSIVCNAYTALILLWAIIKRDPRLFEPRFTLPKFYVLMGWAPAAFVALALLVNVRYLALFVAAGCLGVVGELIVSALWRGFFDRPIWTYSHRAALGGATSSLNFLPWAVGALLFQMAGGLMGGGGNQLLKPMAVSAVAFVVGLAVAWPARRKTSPAGRRFTRSAFALFCLPIATTALALGALCGPEYILRMTIFAPLGFVTEYAYGRTMALFFDRGLWTYNHWPIDGGHSSFVTFPLWALGGLYFQFIAACLGL